MVPQPAAETQHTGHGERIEAEETDVGGAGEGGVLEHHLVEPERGQDRPGRWLVGTQAQDEYHSLVSVVDAELSRETLCRRRHHL